MSAEITKAMMEAGLRAYHAHDSRFGEPEGLVAEIFEAMSAAAAADRELAEQVRNLPILQEAEE